MKNNKGITLISVTIYIIAMLLVISIMTVLAGYFYENIDEINSAVSFNEKFVELNTYFSKEVNEDNNEILMLDTINIGLDEEQTYILFSNGNQYTYINKNESIYVNTYKIIEGIDECTFSIDSENILNISIKQNDEEKTISYQF